MRTEMSTLPSTAIDAATSSISSFPQHSPTCLDFFAGSGLVSYALAPFFHTVWANDICPKKAAVFTANHADILFHLGSISDVSGTTLPACDLSWASFPCQDLSLAGAGKGIHAQRSGLVWEWLRVMDEMPRRPPILAVENVVGLASSKQGAHYRELHRALASRGYRVGAMLLDAVQWLPQSRPRIFVVAVDEKVAVPENLYSNKPSWIHPSTIQKAAKNLENWIWWSLPEPPTRTLTLSQLIDFDAPCHDAELCKKNLALIPDAHRKKLDRCGLSVVPGYKRMRAGKQVLELRFDDVAGCLRTPSGGSSRQYLVIKSNNCWKTRLITPREAARLMGAQDNFQLPGSFNDGYKAMGDAVAVPVASYLAEHILLPLAEALHG